MGLEVVNVDEPFEMPSGQWGVVGPLVGDVAGNGTAGYLVDATSNWVYRGLEDYLEEGGALFRGTRSISTDDGDVAAGAFWLPGLAEADAERLADDFGLTLTGLPSAPTDGGLASVSAPRVAIYRSWQSTMPEGWTRWVLDQYGIAWENVWDADVRDGRLSDFDVVILPAQSESGIRDGHAPGSLPEQYTGGLGADGAAALRSFVQNGGWVVAFDASVDYAISTFDLPFRNRTRGVESSDFFLPGSIIRLEVDPSHPLGYGMASDAVTLFARSQVLEPTAPRSGVSTPVCFPGSDYLVSGWTLGGDEYLAGQTATAQVAIGSGRVILFAFTPHFRGQPRNTFKLLFNALWGSSTEELPLGGAGGCGGG
jgi:hypothetical protein